MGFKNWNFMYGFLAGSSICAIIQWLCNRRSKRKIKRKENLECNDDCLLFSPKVYTIECVRNESNYCGLLSCPVCNYVKFIELLKSAKVSLEICLYLITSDELTTVIINLFKQGLYIRIVLDRQMSNEALNSKMHVFLKEHIPTKIIKTGEMMHNKFVIIDQKILITGSFNWTKQGVLYNYENGVIIHNKNVVGKYVAYFQEIWLSKC